MIKLMLVVLWDGRVLIDLGDLNEIGAYGLLHMANFAVIDKAGDLEVHKERYELGLRGARLTYQQVFEHAARHVRMCKSKQK